MSMSKAAIVGQASNVAGNIGIAGGVGGGGVLWVMKVLGENAAGIGAGSVIIGLIVGIIFKIISVRLKAAELVELKRHHNEIEANRKDK